MKTKIPTKMENPHLYCVMDNCFELHIVTCNKCDGDFCAVHYNENHKNGVCKFE